MKLKKFLLEIEQTQNSFRIKKDKLSGYIRFEEADTAIGDLDIIIYHNLHKNKDHVKERFEERIENTHRIASHTDINLFSWPLDYIKYLHKGLNKINKRYHLNNNAYVLNIKKLGLQYLLIIAQPYEQSPFNLESKYTLVNTLYDDDMKVDHVKFLGKSHPAKKLIIENIENIIKIDI